MSGDTVEGREGGRAVELQELSAALMRGELSDAAALAASQETLVTDAS